VQIIPQLTIITVNCRVPCLHHYNCYIETLSTYYYDLTMFLGTSYVDDASVHKTELEKPRKDINTQETVEEDDQASRF